MEKEKRLIDANALIKEAHWVIRSDGTRVFVVHAEDVDSAEAVDAVEVVRCKGCEFCVYNPCNDAYKCRSMSGMYRRVEPDEFCSYGEKKEA